MSHYDVLGASPEASAEELRRRFLEQARRFHPDRHIGAQASVRHEAEVRMRLVTEAWAVLGDPQRRRHYDLGLRDTSTRATAEARPTPAPSAGPRAGRDPVMGPGARVVSEPRDWRSYAGAGDGEGARRSLPQLALLMSPVSLLAIAGCFAAAGAMVRWPGFWAATVICLLGSAAAFVLLPIWVMSRGNRPRRPRRATRRSY